MNEIVRKTKKWGSSLGIIIPKKIVEQQHIKDGEEIIIDFKKKHIAKEFFGLLPKWKKTAQKLKDEVDFF